MKRMTGFILFWIAFGMFISLFIENMVCCVTLILIFIVIGFNLFCCK